MDPDPRTWRGEEWGKCRPLGPCSILILRRQITPHLMLLSASYFSHLLLYLIQLSSGAYRRLLHGAGRRSEKLCSGCSRYNNRQITTDARRCILMWQLTTQSGTDVLSTSLLQKFHYRLPASSTGYKRCRGASEPAWTTVIHRWSVLSVFIPVTRHAWPPTHPWRHRYCFRCDVIDRQHGGMWSRDSLLKDDWLCTADCTEHSIQ